MEAKTSTCNILFKISFHILCSSNFSLLFRTRKKTPTNPPVKMALELKKPDAFGMEEVGNG